jgi:hypothetical protein
MPEMGDLATCKHCSNEIEYVEYYQWNGFEHEVLDYWWSHTNHPDNNHDGEPV